jgi:hypothetical protein
VLNEINPLAGCVTGRVSGGDFNIGRKQPRAYTFSFVGSTQSSVYVCFVSAPSERALFLVEKSGFEELGSAQVTIAPQALRVRAPCLLIRKYEDKFHCGPRGLLTSKSCEWRGGNVVSLF